jgi:hypothetical protein
VGAGGFAVAELGGTAKEGCEEGCKVDFDAAVEVSGAETLS